MSAFSPDMMHTYLAARRTGLNVEYHEVIDSTNFRAKQLGLDGAPHGTLVIADLQTAGRGRMQRSWESKSGDSILMSLLLRPEKLPPMQATGIVLIAAIAAAMPDAPPPIIPMVIVITCFLNALYRISLPDTRKTYLQCTEPVV
jgi:hypothetical protein